MYSYFLLWLSNVLLLSVSGLDPFVPFEEFESTDTQECRERLDKVKEKSPAGIATVARRGENVALSCHYCGEFSDYLRMRWYKLDRLDAQIRWDVEQDAREVDLDLHDEEQYNRIFLTGAHTLVIKDFQPGDEGTYFCEDYKMEEYISHKLNNDPDQLMQRHRLLILKSRWRFLYHVDVALDSPKTIKVPFTNKVIKYENKFGGWLAINFWTSWSRCSVCGDKTGVRRRKGRCTVITRGKKTIPSWIEDNMKFYKSGMPCHSTLFGHFPEVLKLPLEVQEMECHVSCSDQQTELERLEAENLGLGHLRMKRPLDTSTKKPMLMKTAKVGENISLTCFGSTVDTAVTWMNRTKQVKEDHSRVNITGDNTLHISNTQEWDSGLYTCWYDFKEKVAIHLKVYAPYKKRLKALTSATWSHLTGHLSPSV